jgi:prepilin-type N-terminal cleavage/methylation domain-containing protein
MTCNGRGPQRDSGPRSAGFTLIEVMAAVLVLGLLYTVLAGAAIRGLRSEGTDRRRADAEMIADREITLIETELASGAPLEDGQVEREEEPFKVISNVEPFDVLSMLPAPLQSEIALGADPQAPSLLHDERGQSRMRRITVVVEWDEAGEPDHVERTTFALTDPSVLQQYFASSETAPEPEPGSPDERMEQLRKLAPPELKALMDAPAPKQTRRSGGSDSSR